VWNASPHPQKKGYFVYVGERPGELTATVDVGSATSYVFPGAQPGQEYCFAVAVYTIGDVVSPMSREVCGFSDEPPRLTSPGDQTTVLGTAVLLALKGSDPEGRPITYAATGLPPGLILRADTGVISGSSTVAGTYPVSIVASDGRLSSTLSFTWTMGSGGPIVPPPPSGSDTIAPSTGSGVSQVFTLRYSRPVGGSGLETAWVWFRSTSAVALANSCVARFDLATKTFSLLGDEGTRWQMGPTAAATEDPKAAKKDLKNRNCTIALTGASAVGDERTLTITLPMTFTPAFGGPKNVDLYSTAPGGFVSGWRTRGTWSVPGDISVAVAGLTVVKERGRSSQRIAVQSSSAGEGTDLTTVSMWVRPPDATREENSCMVRYDLRTRRVGLLNDKGTAWSDAQLGSSTAELANRQCAIPLDQGSVVVQTRDSLDLILTLRFSSTFDGKKEIYVNATSSAGTSSGWTTQSRWTVR
jgi:hypothetical protein